MYVSTNPSPSSHGLEYNSQHRRNTLDWSWTSIPILIQVTNIFIIGFANYLDIYNVAAEGSWQYQLYMDHVTLCTLNTPPASDFNYSLFHVVSSNMGEINKMIYNWYLIFQISTSLP